MVTVEVGEKYTVHPRRMDAEAPHAAHRTEAEVEDERLLPCLDHYAALPPPKA
jgi:hypothetical protein